MSLFLWPVQGFIQLPYKEKKWTIKAILNGMADYLHIQIYRNIMRMEIFIVHIVTGTNHQLNKQNLLFALHRVHQTSESIYSKGLYTCDVYRHELDQ